MTTVVEERRERKAPRAMRLQERDIAIGVWLARRRFLDADQICRLVETHEGGSHAHTKTRLTALRENGYIVRPRGERSYWDECGRTYRVYGNTSKMGRILQHRGLVPEGRLDWTQQNRSGKANFVEHTVETSELMVTLETTVRRYPGFGVCETEHLRERLPMKTQTLENPWFVSGKAKGLSGKIKDVVKPDAVFSLRQERRGAVNEDFFFAEVDTTTERVVGGQGLEAKLKEALYAFTNARSAADKAAAEARVEEARRKLLLHNATMNQRSFLQKALVYFWAYKHEWHKQHFGWPSFRVLVTTRSASQRDRMIAALPYVTKGQAPNLFLFATFDDIRRCEDILELEWHNGAGELVSLKPKK